MAISLIKWKYTEASMSFAGGFGNQKHANYVGMSTKKRRLDIIAKQSHTNKVRKVMSLKTNLRKKRLKKNVFVKLTEK